MEPLILIATLFGSFNIVLLGALIYLYLRIFARTHASYSIGLLIFAVFLLLHNAVIVGGYVLMTPFFGDQVYPVLVGFTVLEFGGIIALLRITV
jgi:hypothetical protein